MQLSFRLETTWREPSGVGRKKKDKFQLPFLELLFGHFRIQNKKALERLSWMTFQPVFWSMLTLLPLPLPHGPMLWYAAECGQQHLSPAKFMRLGQPLCRR